MALQSNQIVYTGNSVNLYLAGIKGQLFERLVGDSDANDEAVSGFGDAHVIGVVPTVVTYHLTISKFVMTLEQIAQAVGGTVVVPATVSDYLTQLPFDIEIFSKTTGNLVRKWTQAVTLRHTANFERHRVVILDATFQALDATGTYNLQ